MPDQPTSDCDQLVARAHAGDQEAATELLGLYRNYLLLLARVQVDKTLQAKIEPSDVVQETLLEATRGFPRFRGETEAEFLAWLRRILANAAVTMIRRFKIAQSRDIHREESFRRDLDHTSMVLGRLLPACDMSPSRIASGKEEVVKLSNALAQLPNEYREVLVLHHLEGRPVAEVAARMDRSISAVKGLRARAIVKLRELLKERP